MKKHFLVGAALLTAFTLTACSNSKTAKQNYIDSYTALSNQSQDNNSHDVSIKFDSFDMQGDASSKEINALLNNASMNVKVSVDYNNKVVALNTDGKISDQELELNMLLGKKGVYVENSQVTSLIDNFQSANPYVSLYGQLLDQLDQKYLLVDQTVMENGIASQGGSADSESWKSTYNQFFEKNKTDKKDIEKNFKDIPEKNFTQSGDKVTMKLSGNGDDIKGYLKNLMTTSNKEDVQAMLDDLDKYTNIKSMDVETTLNPKTHESESKINGDIQSKDGKTSAKFKMTVTAKSSKENKSITEPSEKDAISLSQMFKNLMLESSEEVDTY